MQAWANGTTPDYGLALYASTADSNHWKQFGSVYDPDGGPYLTVTYTGVLLLRYCPSRRPMATRRAR